MKLVSSVWLDGTLMEENGTDYWPFRKRKLTNNAPLLIWTISYKSLGIRTTNGEKRYLPIRSVWS